MALTAHVIDIFLPWSQFLARVGKTRMIGDCRRLAFISSSGALRRQVEMDLTVNCNTWSAIFVADVRDFPPLARHRPV